jgi:hypothetical protein
MLYERLMSSPLEQLRALRDTLREQLDRSEIFVAWVAADAAGKGYDIPLSWRYNLPRVFPHDRSLTIDQARLISDNLLDLRNRIAHHEPIYHLPLDKLRKDTSTVLNALCPPTNRFATGACNFSAVWENRPSK